MERIRVLYKKYEELFNYLVVGGLTTVVSMALFYGCVWTVLDGTDAVQLQIANVISGRVRFYLRMSRTAGLYFTAGKQTFCGKCRLLSCRVC